LFLVLIINSQTDVELHIIITELNTRAYLQHTKLPMTTAYMLHY